MANPPANRRPGVDADIFQGQWVRGFDVPAGNDDPAADPCDLIVSNGKSQIDQTVSNLIFASRKDDIGQPIFIMAQGETATAPIGTLGFHIGRDADPNGLISGVGPGALYASYGTPGLWQLQVDNTTWMKISDDLGGEDLQQTLAIGNFSGGFNIVMTSGDSIVGADNALGSDGAPVQLQGGAATGAAGNGGRIIARGGDSANGLTGAVEIGTLTTTSGAQSGSGLVEILTGDSRFGGNSGGIRIQTGDAGDPTITGNSGNITVRSGRNFNTGGFGFAGRTDIIAGQSTQDGQGGYVRIFSGNATTSNQNFPLPFFVQGRAGDIQLTAGNSSGTNEGGFVQLSAGTGGSGGGPGGNILLNVGPGGGGGPDGQVISNGVLSSDNIKRGTQDPNSISLAGNEGDVYQRTAGGLGQVWVNTNGTNTGWQQLAFAGDFVEAYQQMQTGYVSPSMYEFGGADTEKYSDIGLYKGLRTVEAGAGTVTQGFNGTGPTLSSSVAENLNGEQAALDMITNGNTGQGVSLQNRFFATFVVQTASTDDDACRFFVGLSNNDITTQLSADLPGGRYVGFVRSSINNNWVVVHRGSGGANFVNTGVSKTLTDGGTTDDAYYFVIDATEGLLPVVRFFILDPDLQVIANISVPTNIPSAGDELWPAWGVRTVNTTGGGFVSALRLNSGALTTKAATVAQGGGTNTGGLSLSQVLVNGNETGLNPILINQGSSILGVTDDNAGDGAFVSIFGGATTLATNDTGGINVGSGNAFGGGAENPGTSTGVAGFGSGFQLGLTSQGNTGLVNLISGDHLGTDGETGDVNVRSGGFFNGAAGTREQGDVNIAPGSFIPNPATVTGDLILKGGSSNLSGIVGGDVLILSGENNSPSGNTGDIVIETFDALTVGDSGGLSLSTGSAGAVSGVSGDMTIATGSSPGGDTGFLALITGDAGNGTAGPMLLNIGGTTLGDGSDIFVNSGNTVDAAGFGGDIILNPGTGAAGNGAVIVNGKLTVTGLIDPTGLQLTGQASTPVVALPAGDGLLWVDNTAVPSRLIFRDDTGMNNDISAGGGATSLGALTDVTLAAPAVGEVLTFNGAQWTNLPGAGGSPLATTLGLGNTTGGTAGGITVSDSLGDRIVSDGDLRLDPSVAAGDAVVIDGIRWPEADGPAGFVLTTNGLGQLSFQPGGGGGGSSFAEAFAQMQFGALMPPPDVAGVPLLNGTGVLNDVLPSAPGGSNIFPRLDGLAAQFVGIAPNVAPGRFVSANPMTRLDNQGLYVYKFEISNTFGVRLFLGLTTDPSSDLFVSSDAPPGAVGGYVGLSYSTTVPDAGFVFWHSNAAGAGTRVPTGVAPVAGAVYYFALDASIPGQVRMTIYDQDFVALSAVPPIAASLPLPTSIMDVMGALMPTGAVNEALFLYSCNVVHRADLLNVLGGGGNQDLASVLGFGNETGGITIKGSDNNAGAGGVLSFAGGDSTGGGGDGGIVDITTGSPDPGGNGDGGDLQLNTATGAGLGDGGALQFTTGDGGPLGGDAGNFRFNAGSGPGAASGTGGGAAFNLGDGGGAGGPGGGFFVTSGDALAGNNAGGVVSLAGGTGFGTGAGGALSFVAGDGGANGNGGNVTITAGTGNGAGVNGQIFLTGDTTVTGKLNVTGLIDPTGLLLDSQAGAPFVPAGSDGGIWVNNSGELIFTNSGGDLNLSTAIGGGVSWLDALLLAGYGFLGAGNPLVGPQSYGVFGSSVNSAVSPGPPPASITHSQDSEGPFINMAVAAAAGSQAFVGTQHLQLQRNSQFKSRIKFQVTSPAHTDERIFIGFTDDATLASPNPMLASDPPIVGAQYMGLSQSLAGFNLEFVARGSGGSMVNVFAIPTDALVHYLEIDTSVTTEVTFNLYAADGSTLEATHTEPAGGFLVPDAANPLRPFAGIFTGTGTTPRSLDFYDATVVTRADVVDAVTGGGMGATPDLELVLASGNTTGANGIEFSIGNTGITTEAAAAGGENLAISAGDAGGIGNSGGFLFLTGGLWTGAPGKAGGVTIQADSTAAGGATGAVNLQGGSDATGLGASLRVETAQGSGGGNIFIETNGGIGGNNPGGDITIEAGLGQGTSPGGAVFLTAGTGGGGGGTGDGGRILIQAGSPNGTGSEGGIDIFAGSAISPTSGEGAVQLASSPVSADGLTEAWLVLNRADPGTGNGAPISLQAGRADVGTGGDAGDIDILTREGDGVGLDGSIRLLAGNASPNPVAGGGDVQMVAAPTVGIGTGGQVVVSKAVGGLPGISSLVAGAAEAGSGLNGGISGVQGGPGDGPGKGGNALLIGGVAGATGDGGDVQLLGGPASGGANTGGDIRLIPGPGPAGSGRVQIEGPIDPAVGGGVAGIQFGTHVEPAASVFIVSFNTVFASAPQTVYFSLEINAPAIGQATPVIVPGSITASGFGININPSGPYAGPVTVHWMAMA